MKAFLVEGYFSGEGLYASVCVCVCLFSGIVWPAYKFAMLRHI